MKSPLTSKYWASYIFLDLEVILLFLSLIVAVLFGYICWKSKTLHRNVRMILIWSIFATFGYSIARFAYVANDFSHNYLSQKYPFVVLMFSFIQTFCILSFTTTQLAIILDRMMETLYAQFYKKNAIKMSYANAVFAVRKAASRSQKCWVRMSYHTFFQ